MRKDFFTHLGETLKIQIQLLDRDSQPIDLEANQVEFAASKGTENEPVEVLEIRDGIDIVDMELAIVEVNFFPTIAKGYDNRPLVYQVRTIEIETGDIDICLSGTIHISTSLFPED